MISRRTLIIILAGSLLIRPFTGNAEQATKVPKVGWLSDGVRPGTSLQRVFLQSLRALGYVEGQTIIIESRDAGGKIERLDRLATELVNHKVDVIVTTGGVPATRAAKRATTSIPIVMADAGDPVATGLVASLAKPGGNVTGLSAMDPDLTGKRLQLLKEVAPRISHVAVLYHPSFPATVVAMNEARIAAPRLGLTVLAMEVVEPDAYEKAFTAVLELHADSLLTFGDPFTHRYQRRILDLAAKHQLPAMHFLPEFAEGGGLIAYGPSFSTMYRQAAVLVDKILKGAQPRDLPVEQPTKFDLVINLKTAKALGLTIPQSVLLRADEVIR